MNSIEDIFAVPTISYFCCPENMVCPGGEIGRHVRLRGVWRKLCWFESSPGHKCSLFTRLKVI